MTPPREPPPGPSAPSYDDEVAAACRYERGLAAKALIAVAVVAVIVVMRILWF